MPEDIAFKGKLFEIVHLPQADGRVFEVARRAPGVRLIIASKTERKILLTKEFRRELDTWDYRLPGGKVFDSLDEYEAFRNSGGDILEAAEHKSVQEGAEEAGIDIHAVKFFEKSTLGATVEWDLFVFEVAEWQARKDGQQLEAGEVIESDDWVTYGDARTMILNGAMQEHRIALILLKWLTNQEI